MENRKKSSLFTFLLFFFEAMLIGFGGILPGISGGILCVIFGFYHPLVDTLADPIHKLVPNLNVLLPLALGSLFGFIVTAGAVRDFMELNEELASCVFAGLILGMLPDMWKDASKKPRTKASIVALVLSAVLFTAFFMYLKLGDKIHITPNLFWYLLCGVVWGISIVVPGMSSSSSLIFLGLYKPMVDGIAELDFLGVILPVILGIVVTILLLSRAVSAFYDKHFSVASHIIIGIVIATTIPIIPYKFASVGAFFADLAGFVLGIAVAYLLSIVCPKLADKVNAKDTKTK